MMDNTKLFVFPVPAAFRSFVYRLPKTPSNELYYRGGENKMR